MKQNFIRAAATLLLGAGLLVPSLASASGLSSAQASAIIGLLQAFQVDQSVISNVQRILLGTDSSGQVDPVQPDPAHVPVTDSIYRPSNVGYDLSFATRDYPQIPFSFAVVGVTGGKAFVHNPRFSSEYSWARFGSTQPSLYMNLNAPYGSKVAGNVSAPHACDTTASETGAEPTACEGYNFGYNAAKDAYAYAMSDSSVRASVWWLDIEEANSWSLNTAVNDATIQGAIDYLNSKNIRVGIYSVPYMWRDIAGAGFVPTQTVNGISVPTPTWLAIGIGNLVDAANACVTKASFIPTSPIWLLQYVANSTAVDEGYAC